MKIIEVLQEKLIDNAYSLFSIGDTFDLHFDEFWLIAHNVVSSDEKIFNDHLLNNYAPAMEAVDKEDIAKSIVLSATLRKRITNVVLEPDSSLKLTFENDVTLLFPTNTEIVDWQWAINKNAENPYLSCMAGVFDSNEILLNMDLF